MHKRVTQSDVARAAGVSRFTVSCVINNLTGGNVRISEETRQRVLQAIQELGYRQNMLARSLRTNRTQIMAIMVQDLTNPFYPRFIKGAQAVAQEYHYQIFIFDANESAESEAGFLDSLLQGWVDGAILFNFRSKGEDILPLVEAGLRIVTIGARLDIPGISTVISSESQSVTQIMQHLLGQGHKRIAHLAGLQDSPPGIARLANYRKCLEKAGLPYDERLVRYGNFTADGVEGLIQSLFAAPPAERPTALFAANDRMAIESMKCLQNMGLRVPEDVAVIGFDNIPAAAVVTPSLTTIDQKAFEWGRKAAETLLQGLASADEPADAIIRIPSELVLRRSA
ncbi:MAG TPA: LacI family DNA-binding transcriptional regulator [Anaerolineaceae bacterium]|nr:LacI family DNA-binding transcriptional regulator [Anaerolineaceae bacterium]